MMSRTKHERGVSPRLLWLAGTLCALLLAACSSGSPRPTPAELPPGVDLIGVRQVWSSSLAGKVEFPLQAAVNDNRVALASSEGAVVVLDARTGAELVRTGVGEPLTAGVGSDGRRLAVVTRQNEVVVLDGAREAWRQRLPTQSYTPPLVAGGRVFVLGADRSVSAFDGATGARLWHMERPAEPLVLRQAGVLQAVGNTLVAGLSGRVVGIHPDSGDILWEAPLAVARGTNDVERLIDLVGGVHRQGSVLCVRAFQAAVGCVNAANGELLWTHAARGATGIAGDGELLYGAESDGRVFAWRGDNGARAWSTDRLRWRVLTAPLVLGRSVVVGDDSGLVHLLSRTDGSPLSRLNTDKSGVAAAPVVASNTLVVVTRAGGLFGYAPD